jgi:hypothetical protein
MDDPKLQFSSVDEVGVPALPPPEAIRLSLAKSAKTGEGLFLEDCLSL